MMDEKINTFFVGLNFINYIDQFNFQNFFTLQGACAVIVPDSGNVIELNNNSINDNRRVIKIGMGWAWEDLYKKHCSDNVKRSRDVVAQKHRIYPAGYIRVNVTR